MARPQNISDATITEVLATRPEMTAADLADQLGIGGSTAAKRLAALETAGSVRRSPGGRVRGVRVADRWSVAGPAPESAAGDPAGPDPAVGDPAVAETDDPAANGTGAGAPGSVQPDVADAGSAADDAGGGRLGRGELGSLVRDYLAVRPGEAVGPTQVGKALGRSQGAVSNSLAKMAANGEVVLVADKPRRYRIAG
jgi:MarR family